MLLSRMSVLVEVGLVLTLSCYCKFWVFIVSQDHHFYIRKGSSIFNYLQCCSLLSLV